MAIRYTTEGFIEKAKKIHGGRYDYSQSIYLGGQKPVSVVCPLHGPFCQRASHHLAGRGCPECGGTKKKSTSEFILRANEIHCNKYRYTETVYKDAKTPVAIVCPEHGQFMQTPDAHLHGRGCQKCGGSSRLSTREFIDRAQIIHKGRYDYRKVEYHSSTEPVIINCPEHGDFEQTPQHHLAGKGCIKCSYEVRGNSMSMGKKRFLSKAKELHGDHYDYSLVHYKNWETPVKIICPDHGLFLQRPGVHLRGASCPTCGHGRSSAAKYSTKDEFIRKAREFHSNHYDYTSVDYVSATDKVKIVCREHGEFLQTPNSHLNGSGCPVCGREGTIAGQISNTSEYIDKARAIHGDRYDYSDVKYTGASKKIEIRCPEHGFYSQQANNHLSGNGCPQCASSGIDVNAPGILYYIRVDTKTQTFWKIGITNRSVKERFVGNMDIITVLKVWEFDRLELALIEEVNILQKYATLRYRGDEKPLHRGGNSELFTSDILGLDEVCSRQK